VTLSLEEQIRRLTERQRITEAREQITEVLHRYARGWDRLDEEALRSCFFADSTHEHGAFKGLSSEFVSNGLAVVGKLRSVSHLITNVSIEIAGDRAVSECYFLAHHRREAAMGTDEDWFLKGRYLDRFEERQGVWKIAHRRGLHDFSRTFRPADASLDAAPAGQRSARAPDDPWYALLASLKRPETPA